jgi:hypothetical protein
MSLRAALVAPLVVALVALVACSSVSTVRLSPENVAVGHGVEAVAAVQASATSAYLLFVPIPGGVDLDRVINRMLIVAAKTIGADKIQLLDFEVTPDTGLWTLRKLLGWRSASARGIAVRVAAPADADADAGPEPAAAPSAPPASPAP